MKTKKPKIMSKENFAGLLGSIREGGAYLRGENPPGVKVDKYSADSVAAIRGKLKLSQSQFARSLGISVNTLQNWEQGRVEPSGPAKVLLKIASKHPEVVLEACA
jgi:putative transcriptional regulator